MEEIPRILISVLAISFAVLFPLTFAIGVLVTFRVAGPVYRFETYLGRVAGGEDPGVLRLRDGDELEDLCSVINQVRDRYWAEGDSEALEQGEEGAAADAAATPGAPTERELRKVG